MSKTLLIHTDGGARGNPGPAAIGLWAIDENGQEVFSFGKKIGETTNNVAEYRAILEAFNWFKENHIKNICIKFFLDSLLVVNQLSGIFKIKEKHLQQLVMIIKQNERETGGKISYHFVPRAENRKADKLVNETLDR